MDNNNATSENPWLNHPDLGDVARNFVIPGEHNYDGRWYFGGYLASCLDRIKTFQFRDDDVVLVTYPKSGTHWTKEIMKHILHIAENTEQAQGFKIMELTPSKRQTSRPFIDIIESLPSPRVYISHLVVDYFRAPLETKGTKFVVVVRNVKDTLVSLYHMYRGMPELGHFTGTFDDFMEMVKVNRIRSWFEWVLGWGEYKDHPNVIFLKYEDMKKDLPTEVQRLANFLETDVTEDEISDVYRKTSFANMQATYNGLGITDGKISPFIRKGEVGDWKKYFSEESNSYIDMLYQDVKSKGLHFDSE